MSRQDDIKAERTRANKNRNKAVSHPDVAPLCRGCRFGYCYILQAHHIHPLGESDTISQDIVLLCPNCHAIVHEMRRLYYAPSRKNVRYRTDRIEQLAYWRDRNNPELVARLLELARRGIE